MTVIIILSPVNNNNIKSCQLLQHQVVSITTILSYVNYKNIKSSQLEQQ